MIMPYINDTHVFVCPDDPAPTMSPNALGVDNIPRSYVAAAASEDLQLEQIDQPADTIVITEKWSYDKDHQADGANTASWMETFTGDMAPNPANPTQANQDPASWHQGGMNNVFFDGHAKWLRPTTIWNSADYSGCTLVHENPTSEMCDNLSAIACSSPEQTLAAGNICDNPRFFPYPSQ
jgi:prepilin-type processing-associated H-X9-DG protein